MPVKNNKTNWVCAYCHTKQTTPFHLSNNGSPLVEGRVCGDCNIQVIICRIRGR